VHQLPAFSSSHNPHAITCCIVYDTRRATYDGAGVDVTRTTHGTCWVGSAAWERDRARAEMGTIASGGDARLGIRCACPVHAARSAPTAAR
jgi:hypothetical protein